MGGLHDLDQCLHPTCGYLHVHRSGSSGLPRESMRPSPAIRQASVKAGVPLIYATDREDVAEVFEERAQELACPSHRLGRDFGFQDSGAFFDFFSIKTNASRAFV